VNNSKKFLLSNYPLIYQLFIINLIVSLIGFTFLLIFNFYLVQNDRNISQDYDFAFTQVNKITNFLEKNSILRVTLFNENCKNIENTKNCENISFKAPELEPTRTQQYIIQNFFNEDIDVKVYNDNWIKFADTNDMYISTEVEEIDLKTSLEDSIKFLDKYKYLYLDIFEKYRRKFIYSKHIESSWKLGSEINIVSETIKNKKILSRKFINKDKDILQILSSPILKNNKIYGVVIISYPLISNNVDIGLTSFNLFNFYIFFVITMLLLSFFFSKSLVLPIKELSKLTVIEREKVSSKKFVKYPIRKDEIGTLSKEIQNMSLELKSQIEQLEKFAADVSHELKNPLTSLQSANELINNNRIEEKNKQLLINNMSKDIERMNRLISDISNYTKIKAEIEIENFEYIQIDQFIESIVEEYLDNNKNIKIEIENNIDIKIDDFDKIITVLVNKNKFAQVFYNLIDNSISVLEENKKILINIKNVDDHRIIFKLYDQGRGIPIDQSKKIFDRFYTDRETDKEKHTGLGLSIAREIIHSFKGSLKLIKSDRLEYSGACFTFNLPLKIIKKK
tara:strand:+ start:134 stop:1828 length:1695 start_codon:yes stop_codon:yes gene_type:complete